MIFVSVLVARSSRRIGGPYYWDDVIFKIVSMVRDGTAAASVVVAAASVVV